MLKFHQIYDSKKINKIKENPKFLFTYTMKKLNNLSQENLCIENQSSIRGQPLKILLIKFILRVSNAYLNCEKN